MRYANPEPYRHHYGGMARDTEVTKKTFAKLFGMSLYQCENCETDMKVGDKTITDNKNSMNELLGYVYLGPRGGRHYVITLIQF